MNSPVGTARYKKEREQKFLALSHYHEDQKEVDLHKFEMDIDRHAEEENTTNEGLKPALELTDFNPSLASPKTHQNNKIMSLKQIRELNSYL